MNVLCSCSGKMAATECCEDVAAGFETAVYTCPLCGKRKLLVCSKHPTGVGVAHSVVVS
jgi:predicted RNA-binding Zn-ribbon protein involved in translation (DUF1610 family)